MCVVNANNLRSGHTQSCGCLKLERIKAQRKVNRYEFYDTYIIGYTTNEEKFFIDVDDFELIKNYCWSRTGHGYLETRKNQKLIRMHNIIIPPPENKEIDHIDRDGMNNRKYNLRVATHQENSFNVSIKSNNTSGAVGVCYNGRSYIARIKHNYKDIHLGSFDTFEEAVNARKQAEQEYFGEFAYKESIR
jgi:hypothetical protein